ncbi:MAG: hypothetical protein EB127_19850, partial [Alphaproteobacteria bacterium]|nr:hypothetical protein [Alphaproteobacteria bacterium]
MTSIADQFIEVLHVPKSPNHDHKELTQLVYSHIHALMYNVASIVSVLALMKGKSRIQCNDVEEARNYIKRACSNSASSGQGQQTGGSFPSEYFGYDFNAYSASSGNEQIASQAQFGRDGYVRPAIDIETVGGSPRTTSQLLNLARSSPVVKKYILSVVKQNGVSISKAALHDLLTVLDIHIT